MIDRQDVLMLEDLDSFVRVLTEWHKNKVAMVTHMKGIPSGSEVSFGDDVPQTLEGDYLNGFKAGIAFSLIELGTLPFFTVTEEAPPKQPDLFADAT